MSIVTVVVGQVILVGLFVGFHAGARTANATAFVVSGVLSYVLNRRWTWGRQGSSHLWREIVPFWAIGLVGLLASTWAAGVAASQASEVTDSRVLQALAVDAAVFATVGLLWIAKFVALGMVFGDKADG